MKSFKQFFLLSFIILCCESPSLAQLTTGFTFSRSYGKSNASSSSTVVLGSSRVLGESCKSQFRSVYKNQNIKDVNNQGCIVSPKNVVALPSQENKLDQFKILDPSRAFAVGDSTSAKTIENSLSQKTVGNFSSYGYSVFTAP